MVVLLLKDMSYAPSSYLDYLPFMMDNINWIISHDRILMLDVIIKDFSGGYMGGKISAIIPGSIAEEIGVEAGDELLTINDELVLDLIDYNYHCSDEYLEMEVQKPGGDIWFCEVEKYADEELGMVFEANVFDHIRPCKNHCLFCFVDQLQPNPRPSLLLKDDDYRMSFLSGNYITCTNLTERDYQRIANMRLSPLYVSVHSVNPIIRQKLLGLQQPAEIMLTLQRLIAIGCRLHTQIVLCPDINDGEYLEQTIEALYSLRSGIISAAVVPVGITKYQNKPELRLYTKDEAGKLLDYLEAKQQRFFAESKNPFIFAADELYARAGRSFPKAELYGDFVQIENGIGMAAKYLQEWEQCRTSLPKKALKDRIAIVTGINGHAVLKGVISEIKERATGTLELVTVENSYYGSTVTATGLLTGTCLVNAICPGEYDIIIIPDNMLKFDEDMFLDNMTVEELQNKLQAKIKVCECHPFSLVKAIFQAKAEEAEDICLNQ